MMGTGLVTEAVMRGLGGGALPCTDLSVQPHVVLLIIAGTPGPAPHCVSDPVPRTFCVLSQILTNTIAILVPIAQMKK